MENNDLETRGRPRNKKHAEVAAALLEELKQNGLYRKKIVTASVVLLSRGAMSKKTQVYKTFRESASFKELKHRIVSRGNTMSAYHNNGTITVRVGKEAA